MELVPRQIWPQTQYSATALIVLTDAATRRPFKH
jgi:hypothetical protein